MHGANKTLEQAQTWRKHVCHTWQTGLEAIVWLFRRNLEANCWVAVVQSLGSRKKFASEGAVGRVGILCLLVADIVIAPRPARPTVGLEVPM